MLDKVYIKKSDVCKGIGLFAKETIETDTIITWYYGKIDNVTKNNKYIIDYDTKNGVENLIGITDMYQINNNINKEYGKGLAQFANDAIISIITNKCNNSHFIQKDNHVLLISNKKILKDEEVLVSYGIEYWINEIKNSIKEYNDKFCNIIKFLYYIKKLVYNEYRCNIYDFKMNNNMLEFYLEVDKRWCNIFEDWHYDDYFYFIIKINDNKYYVYNYCKTCKKDEIIDISENPDFIYILNYF